jgi:hypothetical protein
MKKQLFDWFFKKEITFTIEEVKDLVDQIKVFNAGAIDPYLTKHADKVVEEWLLKKKAASKD